MKTYKEIIADAAHYKRQSAWLADYVVAVPDVVKKYMYETYIPTMEEFGTVIDYFDGLSHILYFFPGSSGHNMKMEYLYRETYGTRYTSPIDENHPHVTYKNNDVFYSTLYDRPADPWMQHIGHDFNILKSYLSSWYSHLNTDEDIEKRDIVFDFCRPTFRTIFERYVILSDEINMTNAPIIWTNFARRGNYLTQSTLCSLQYVYHDSDGKLHCKYYGEFNRDMQEKCCLHLKDMQRYSPEEMKELYK